jgi:hypothetical protein
MPCLGRTVIDLRSASTLSASTRSASTRDTPSLQILRDMRRRSPVKSSSNDSDYTGSDTDDGVEPDTDLIEVNEFADNNNESDEDEAWLSLNKDHPPEHYLQQLEMFDEQEYTRQDYKDSSTRLIDRMEDQWNQYVSRSCCSLR